MELLLCVAVDSEDGVVTIVAPGILTLEADFLLGHDLEFCDADHDKILGLDDKYSGWYFFKFYLLKFYLTSLVTIRSNL